MTASVVEDVAATSSWRRRVVGGWVAAVTAVTGGAAGLGALAWWQLPLVSQPATWGVVAVAATGGGLVHLGWRRWFRRPREPRPVWREQIATPRGPASGWALPRPPLFSRKDRLSTFAVMTAFAVPVTVGTALSGELLVAAAGVAFAVPAGVGLVRRAARRGGFPPGLVLAPEGLVTAGGLVAWDEIGEVEIRPGWGDPRVRLAVAGRRRRVTLVSDEYGQPAAEVARLIERYRQDPRLRATLALGARPPGPA